jgi:hypothetical protein
MTRASGFVARTGHEPPSVAAQARERTAQHLLAERLTLIRERRARAEATEQTAPTRADAAVPRAVTDRRAGLPPAIPVPVDSLAVAGREVWPCLDCGRVSGRTRPSAGRCLVCERRRLTDRTSASGPERRA